MNKFFSFKALTITFFLLFLFSSALVIVNPASAQQSAIASAHPLATQAGIDILDSGGNAFDAAVAVAAMLAVVEPSGSGFGGGGFWLLHRAEDQFEIMIDGREKAPLAAHKDMFLNADGSVNQQLSRNSALAAGIPGMPAALVHIAEKYGRLSLKQSLAPAINRARIGFKINNRHRRLLSRRLSQLQTDSAAASIFLQDNELPDENSVLIQQNLASTIESIANKGKAGFYQGWVAEKLVQGNQLKGGIWNRQDLIDYQIVERPPVYGSYHNTTITSASPPSSGGIVLIEALNILENLPLSDVDEVTRKHLIIEALRRAYRDRALYLGDPDFVTLPTHTLLNKHYAKGLTTTIKLNQVTNSNIFVGNTQHTEQGADTTHYSIIDSTGNRVAATLSINFPFGSGIVAPGTGVIFNNEMDDFVSKPGALNAFGLTGGDANEIAAGKRMLSSMTPTFLSNGNRIAVIGTPGGSRIISMVLLATLDFHSGQSAESWVTLPRFHHQFIPDHVQYEKGALTNVEIQKLEQYGHKLVEKNYRYGNMQVIQYDQEKRVYQTASDPRGLGLGLIQSH